MTFPIHQTPCIYFFAGITLHYEAPFFPGLTPSNQTCYPNMQSRNPDEIHPSWNLKAKRKKTQQKQLGNSSFHPGLF